MGTINSIAAFIGLPIWGIISDRYGRKPAFVWSGFFCAIFGVCKSFSWIYGSYLAFEFLENIMGATVYATGCILGNDDYYYEFHL